MNTMNNLKNTWKQCVKWTKKKTKGTTAMTTTSNTTRFNRTCKPFYVDSEMFWDAENDIIDTDERELLRKLRTN